VKKGRAFLTRVIINLRYGEPFRGIVKDYFKRVGGPDKLNIKNSLVSPFPYKPTDENEKIFPNKGVPLTASLQSISRDPTIPVQVKSSLHTLRDIDNIPN
jgi:hypothetical protein